MKTTVAGSLFVGLALLTGCTMQNPNNLSVHEALFYGGNQQRFAWVYGTLSGGESTVKLADRTVALRPQVAGDVLGVSGTLSVDGRAAYTGTTSATSNRINVSRSGSGYTVQALSSVEAVYVSDGSGWFRLSGPISAGQTVLATPTASSGLRGAGDLTDAEAEAIGAELKGQGALAVAVLPDSSLPDAPLKVEPALVGGAHLLTGLYLQSGIAQAPSSSAVSSTPAPAPSGASTAVTSVAGSAGRQLAGGSNASAQSFEVVVAQNLSALSNLWSTAYGRQSSVPALPSLSAGRSVVGVFLGQRPTGGYSISLNSARIVNGVLELNLNVNAPGPGTITTQALTSPWLAAEITGTFSSVVVRDAANGRILR